MPRFSFCVVERRENLISGEKRRDRTTTGKRFFASLVFIQYTSTLGRKIPLGIAFLEKGRVKTILTYYVLLIKYRGDKKGGRVGSLSEKIEIVENYSAARVNMAATLERAERTEKR